MFSKKAQGSSGLKLIITAAVLIAILLLAWYFMSRGGSSVTTATGCGEYPCVENNAECHSEDSRSGWVLSTPCRLPDGHPKEGEAGRCCQPNPLG